MKLILVMFAAAGAVAMVPAAMADEALAKKHNCTACHQTDKKSVGPAYKEVAKKYKGQADAVAKLSEKVKKGGSGVWGKIPMPPNANVPDAEIQKLVQWVMTL
jgi:cytochrome c